MFKQFKSLAQLVGLVVITLTTLYGSLAFFGGDALVNAALGNLESGLLGDRVAPANAPAAAPVPSAFNYRGTLRDSNGNLVASGEYTLTFKIYEAIGSTTALFSQTQGGIIVRDGGFNTTLSGIPAATFTESGDRFIGVTVEPLAEMVPRERLASVPYAVQAEDAHNGVPVGGVVDWWRPNASTPIPDGFVACDGGVVNDALSPYNGLTTPDLRGRMIRGAETTGTELAEGGAAQQTVEFSNATSVAVQVSTTTNGNHDHGISGFTGSVSQVQLTDPGLGDYWVRNNEGTAWSTSSHLIAGPGTASTNLGEGNHYHSVGTLAVGAAGSHAHQVNIPSLSHTGTQTIDTVPPYTNLLKICRIR